MNELERLMRAWIDASVALAVESSQLQRQGRLVEVRDGVSEDVVLSMRAISAGIAAAERDGRDVGEGRAVTVTAEG